MKHMAEAKQAMKRLVSVALVLCMAVLMVFGGATKTQAASSYKKTITKTFKLPAYTQFGIWVQLNKPGKVKAVVTSQAKKKADQMALVALGSGNGEKNITSKTKKVTLSAKTATYDNPKAKTICLYLTNGSSKAVTYKVTFSATSSGGKVKYLRKEDNGEGAG